MALVIKLLGIMLMMNIFLYLGMNLATDSEGNELFENTTFQIKGDLMDKLLGDSLQNVAKSIRENTTDYNLNPNETLTSFPGLAGGEGDATGNTGFSFLDAIKISIDFIKLLFNIALSPVALFTSYRLNPLFAILIGVPYVVLFITTLILIIRGVSS